jgi:hypothetical protein
MRKLVLLSTVVPLVLLASAAQASSLSAFEAYATIESVGLRVVLDGDDNGNAVVFAEIRRAGDADFVRGHRLLPVGFETTATLPAGMQVGSLFFLEPETDYEVRAVLEDPDNPAPVLASATVRTRPGSPPAPSGATIYVSDASGDDANDGSSPSSAVRTIGRGVSLAGPGTRVLVSAGVYYEAPEISVAGTPTDPLWIQAEGPGVVLDGSDPTLATASWTDRGGGVWSAPYVFAGTKHYAAVDGKRIYDHDDLASLEIGTPGIPDAFYADGVTLYVKLADGSSPAAHALSFAREQRVLFETVDHVVLDGFELRYYWDAAVDLRDSGHCWIQNNLIHHSNDGVRIRLAAGIENVIQGNRLLDDSVVDWPWDAVKSHDAEGSGIGVEGGRGNVVRNNEIDGFFNGIGSTGWPDFNPEIATETDITRNIIRNVGDDGFEPDGPAVNQRFVGNAIDRVYNALSFSPLNPGPVWVLRNVVTGYSRHVVKLNYLTDPPVPLRGWMLLYHNTALPADGAVAPGATYLAPQAQFEHLVTKNNIFVAHAYAIQYELGPSLLGPIDFDYDDLFSTRLNGNQPLIKWAPDVRYDTLVDFAAATGYEQNGFELEPAFQAPAVGDYTLVEGSPLLDVGVVLEGINDRWNVDGPDVGAVERGLGMGGLGPGGGGPGGAGAGAGAAGGNGAGTEGSAGDEGGCGCRLAPRPRPPAWWLGAAAALALGRRAARGRRVLGVRTPAALA